MPYYIRQTSFYRSIVDHRGKFYRQSENTSQNPAATNKLLLKCKKMTHYLFRSETAEVF